MSGTLWGGGGVGGGGQQGMRGSIYYMLGTVGGGATGDA